MADFNSNAFAIPNPTESGVEPFLSQGLVVGAIDLTPPFIDNISPTPDTDLTKFQAITFDVTDYNPGFRSILIGIRYTNDPFTYFVHDGSSFVFPFDSDSTKTLVSEIDNDQPTKYSYSIKPITGWKGAIDSLFVIAFDQVGNVNSIGAP